MRRLATACVMLCGTLLALATWMPARAHAAQTPPPNWVDAAIAQNNRNCVSPPANFDATTASDQDLAKYGILPRPSDPRELPAWTTIAKHSKYRACGLVRDPKTHHGHPPILPGNSSTTPHNTTYSPSSNNWSGFAVKEGSTYNAVRGWYNMNCASVGHASMWVGIGGTSGLGGTNYNDPLWQAGWDVNRQQFWFEGVNGGVNTGGAVYWTNYNGHTPTCGDGGYSVVYDYPSSYQTLYAYVDDSNGAYASFQYGGTYDAFYSTEWILERPSCYINGTFVSLFQFAGGLQGDGPENWSGDFWYDIRSQGYYGIGQSNPNYRLRMYDPGNGWLMVDTTYLNYDPSYGQYRLFTNYVQGYNGSSWDYRCA